MSTRMPARDHRDVASYYNYTPAEMAETTGAGLIWFMGRDHLSPPLSNADQYALDSGQWREASSQRVLGLAKRLGMGAGHLTLELGCGIGGPGRDIAAVTGATVLGISISDKQLQNLRRISRDVGSRYTGVAVADMQRLPFGTATMDSVYSINAIYHVDDPRAVISESHRVLQPGGQFGVDDWFVTDSTSPEQLAQLRNNWSTSSNGFHNFDKFAGWMQETGFVITDTIDFTAEAGQFLSEERFGVTFDAQVAPTLIDVFPKLYGNFDGYKDEYAEMGVAQLRADVLYMGELYRSGDAVYRQIIGTKPLQATAS